MSYLVSPSNEVNIRDMSYYVAGQETAVPLIILATGAEKEHPFSQQASLGVSNTVSGTLCTNCAIGTFEHGVVRTVTSIRQSLELYGHPSFLKSADGVAHHGDARNEYGLLALNQYLNIGRRAFVVRANVNLNDDPHDIAALWRQRVERAKDRLAQLFTQWVQNYNDANGYVPASTEQIPDPLDPNNLVTVNRYRRTVDDATVKTLVRQALQETTFTDYTFNDPLFADEFLRDHNNPTAGYQEIQLDDTRGWIVGNDTTGLDPSKSYHFLIQVNGYNLDGSSTNWDDETLVVINGADALTYDALVTALNTELTARTTGASVNTDVTVALVNGRLRFTSGVAAATSSVLVVANIGQQTTSITTPIVSDPLFVTTGLRDVVEVLDPVPGHGNGSLVVYDDFTYSTVGSPITSFAGFDDDVDVAQSAVVLPSPGIATDPANMNDYGSWSINDNAATGGVANSIDMLTVLESAAETFLFTYEFRQLTMLGNTDAERRETIVKALVREIKTNRYIRNELYEHNLVLCPGYPEVNPYLREFIESREIKEEVFGLAALPMDKAPDGPNGLLEWMYMPASGAAGHPVAGTRDMACWYPHPLVRNTDGEQVLGCSTGAALRQIAYNDYVAEPWFAPAGTTRGNVSGTDDIGYATGELGGPTEFVQVHLEEGQRDGLYLANINPINYFPTHGIVVFGQKTRQSVASALDRINVSRLIKYIKRALRKASLPFTFEQNDEYSRRSFKSMIDNYLSLIASRRGLYDYATWCDEANNPPALIDMHVMRADVALKPIKAIEWTVIDLAVLRTGDDIGTGRTVYPTS